MSGFVITVAFLFSSEVAAFVDAVFTLDAAETMS
jgi:hypothetical protein